MTISLKSDPTQDLAARVNSGAEPETGWTIRSRLFIKYVALFVGVVALALLSNGIFEVYFYYREHKAALIRIQHEQAEAAAAKISQFIKEIESQIGWTTQLPWSTSSTEQRRFDALRLLRQVPAITELAQVDATGRERLRISRLAMDVIESGQDFSKDPKFTEAVANKVYYGPVYFRRESEPYMTLALAGSRKDSGVTIAEVNLKLIWDVVSQIRVGEHGNAYVVGSQGRLIAHPDISLVLRNTDMSGLAQVRAALTGATMGDELQGEPNIQGQQVLTASAPIVPLRWTMFVELPVEEAYASLYAALKRLALVLLTASIFAVLAGIFLARRMVGPIRALGAGAARIGRGDFSQRISIRTGDELEGLANQFNDMGAKLQESYADLERKVEQRTAELSDSLKQQTATSEVLQVISASPGELTPVFEAVLVNVMRLCQASHGLAWLREDEGFRSLAAIGSWPEQLIAPSKPGSLVQAWPDTPVATAARAGQVTQIVAPADSAANQTGDPQAVALGIAGLHTLLAVPMLQDDACIGGIVLARRERTRFSDKQIELVGDLAAQAVLAVENARLLNALRDRTNELSRSLDELRAAQDRLVQSEKLASLGQLTAGIAHEIKNPLNFINNFSSLSAELIDELNGILQSATLDPNTRDEVAELTSMLKSNLAKVVQHGGRADSIVKNMLLHSRQGAGEHRATDINAILDESLNLAYHGARAENPAFNIDIRRDFDAAAGSVDCFPQEITRVFLNLISNGFYAAVKHKPSAGEAFAPTLTASTADCGATVQIRIRDNGAGIPQDVLAKIFNPFFTTKPAGEGTGLGLSMSHDIIVKQHGGRIDVETRPGEFTEFIITLSRVLPAQSTIGGKT